MMITGHCFYGLFSEDMNALLLSNVVLGIECDCNIWIKSAWLLSTSRRFVGRWSASSTWLGKAWLEARQRCPLSAACRCLSPAGMPWDPRRWGRGLCTLESWFLTLAAAQLPWDLERAQDSGSSGFLCPGTEAAWGSAWGRGLAPKAGVAGDLPMWPDPLWGGDGSFLRGWLGERAERPTARPGRAQSTSHPQPGLLGSCENIKKGQIKVCEWLQRAAQWLQGREPPPTADHDLPAPKMRLPRIRVDPKADDKCP